MYLVRPEQLGAILSLSEEPFDAHTFAFDGVMRSYTHQAAIAVLDSKKKVPCVIVWYS